MLKINLQVGNVSTMADNSVKLTMYTPELEPEAMSEVFRLKKAGECVAVLQSSENDTHVVEALEIPVEGKTPAERLRAVLYRVWEYTGDKNPFPLLYEIEMDKIISHYKAKLPPK